MHGDDGDQRRQHEHAGELHDDGHRERPLPDEAPGSDDLGHLVHAGTRENACGVIVEPQGGGQRDERDHERAEDDDERDRRCDLLVAGVAHPCCCGDGCGAADREPARREQTLRGLNTEPLAAPQPEGHSERHHSNGQDDDTEAERGDGAERELEAEQHDADAQSALPGQVEARAPRVEPHGVGGDDAEQNRHEHRAEQRADA